MALAPPIGAPPPVSGPAIFQERNAAIREQVNTLDHTLMQCLRSLANLSRAFPVALSMTRVDGEPALTDAQFAVMLAYFADAEERIRALREHAEAMFTKLAEMGGPLAPPGSMAMGNGAKAAFP